jgi:hypothetical protein
MFRLRKDQLCALTDILGLSSSGRNTEHADRILNFLVQPVDAGKSIPQGKVSIESTNKSHLHSNESVPTDDDDHRQVSHYTWIFIVKIRFRFQNMSDDQDDPFDNDDTGEADEDDDDDYLGSDDDDDDDVISTINDDPDDFVYQPGRKAPRKKSPMKRLPSSTGRKRKRGQLIMINLQRQR